MTNGNALPRGPRSETPAEGSRVLIAIEHLGGGTGVHVLSLLPHLRRHGWNPNVLCYGVIAPGLDSEQQSERVVPLCRIKRFPFVQAHQLLHTARAVRRHEPLIVHAYFFWPIIFARLLHRAGVAARVVENREDMGFDWGRPEYVLLGLTRPWAGEVICVSEAVRRVVLEREGLDPRRTHVVRNGIGLPDGNEDIRARVRASVGLTDDNVLIGMVANLNRSIKGVQYFLDAMPAILAEIPHAHFLIVGGGHLEHGLRRHAQEASVAERISFTGYQESVRPYYAAMDISVLTSLSEGLSITLLESMSHGLPVVATRVGGNPELIHDSVTGFLVPPREPQRLAEVVIRLARDPGLRRAVGAAARRHIQQHFTLREAASRYSAVYQSLVESVNG